jgi:hypothetical protein
MIHMEGEVEIKLPSEAVFDFVADARNEPRYNPHILRAQKISDGPITYGTKFRNETRSMGRTIEWIIEISSYERPRRLETPLHSSAMDISGAMMFDSIETGTNMHWSWDMKPRGIFRFATVFIRRWGRRLEERNWENLKSFLEAEKQTNAA